MQERALPDGWEWVDLKKFVFFQEGPGIRKWQFKKTGIKLLNVGNLVNGALKLNKTERHVDENEVVKKYSHFLLDPDDIVMASSGVTWGKTSVISKEHLPLMLNTSTIRLRSLDERKLDKKYLQIFINSRLFKNQIDKLITGSAQPNFGSSHLKQVKLLLPPLPLQRQIVAVLENAEAVKRQRQEADALTGALLQSVFYEMFGDPVKNEKGWDIVKIDEVCDEITVGIVVRPASYYVEDGIPSFRSLNIRPDKLSLENFVYIKSSDNDTVLSKSKIRSGDVLVVRTGYPGTACVVPPEFDGANCIDLIILRPKKQLVDCNYLSRFLNSEYGKAQALAGNTGLAQQHLNIGAIRQVKIPLPPLALQQQFARFVESVERIREQQGVSGNEIEGLCEGLMARAFTGELVA